MAMNETGFCSARILYVRFFPAFRFPFPSHAQS